MPPLRISKSYEVCKGVWLTLEDSYQILPIVAIPVAISRRERLLSGMTHAKTPLTASKRYLLSPPILGAPVLTKPLLLYIVSQELSLGDLCAQENSEGKERALHYLSHTLVKAALNYSPIEKICLALMFVVQKLRHYMQSHIVYVISKADPIKYILSRPVLHGRLTK